MSGTKLKLTLDRESATYTAGEIVSGSLEVVSDQDVMVRCIRVNLSGEGCMRYHSSRGDELDHTDFDEGSKIYEEHWRTLFGNLYCTSTILWAGSGATFGDASGDGTFLIPILPGVPHVAIVRVMDRHTSMLTAVLAVLPSDTFSSDTVLGEAVVDLDALTLHADEHTYELFRDGQSEGSVITLSAIHITNAQQSDLCELRVQLVAGLRQANFVRANNIYIQAYLLPVEQPVDRTKALPGPEFKVVLPAGVHNFPFSFPIRRDAPGTAELNEADKSYIRYTITGIIEGGKMHGQTVTKGVTVIPTYPKPAAHLLYPIEYRDATPVRMSSCCCCFPCLSGLGTVTVQAALGRQVFASGEPLELTASVQNATSSPLVVAVVLERVTMFRTTSPHRSPARHTCSSSTVVYEVCVEAGQVWCYDAAHYGHRVPPSYPSFFGARGLPGPVSDPITFSYLLGVVVQARGWLSLPNTFFGGLHRAMLPITISACPPSAAALNAALAENRPPVLQRLSAARPSLQDEWLYSSSEEQPQGVVVPLGERVDLRRGSLSSTAAFYQPAVLSFRTSTASTALQDQVPLPLQVELDGEDDNGEMAASTACLADVSSTAVAEVGGAEVVEAVEVCVSPLAGYALVQAMEIG